MSFVLVHLKECLDQKEIEEAEALARACGMTLDEWLVHTLKSAIRAPEGVSVPLQQKQGGKGED